MNKEELATKYANDKAEELSLLIKQAYLKGYEQALLDTNKSISMNGIEYVNLGLPSGTLWSKNPLMINGKYKKVNYSEAINLPIPTLEQWKELCEFCDFAKNKITAPYPSCQSLYFDFWREGLLGEECSLYTGYKFWLKDENPDKYASVMIYCYKKDKTMVYHKPHTIYQSEIDYTSGADYHFTGYCLPVFLVKNKE